MNQKEEEKEDKILTVITFNSKARKVYGPGKLPLKKEEWNKLENELVVGGGTSIYHALDLALDIATKIVTEKSEETLVVLMTDGADSPLYNDIVHFLNGTGMVMANSHIYGRNAMLFEQMTKLPSGLEVALWAICKDANAHLMESLAKLANGTFTTIDGDTDDEISLTLGSLYGLLQEKIFNAVTVETGVVAVSDDAKTKSTMVVSPQRINLRVNMPTNIPVEIPTEFFLAEKLRMVARVRLLHIGSSIEDAPPPPPPPPPAAGGLSRTFHHDMKEEEEKIDLVFEEDHDVTFNIDVSVIEREIIQSLELDKSASQIDLEVAVHHVLQWEGTAARETLEVLQRREFDAALQINTKVLDKVKALVAKIEEGVPTSPAPLQRTDRFVDSVAYALAGVEILDAAKDENKIKLDEIVERLEAKGVFISNAKNNVAATRELAHRMASEASTYRNGGISVGDERNESQSQAYGRTLSLALAHAE